MLINLIKLVFLSVISANVCSAGSIQYLSYFNTAAGYKLSYPKDILYPQGESGNHMGQVFKSKDSNAILYTFGEYNVDDLYIEDIFYLAKNPDDKDERVFTYSAIGKNWIVVSGIHNDKIFYMKKILSKENYIKTIRFRYDKNKSKIYNKITSKISKSFISKET